MKRLEFSFWINSDTRHLTFLRQIFPSIARMRGIRLRKQDIHRLTLILVEAYNNAHFHGHKRNPKKKIEIGIALSGKSVSLTLTDEGRGIQKKGGKMPEPWALTGRGIPLIQSCCQKWGFRRVKGRNRLEMIYRYGK